MSPAQNLDSRIEEDKKQKILTKASFDAITGDLFLTKGDSLMAYKLYANGLTNLDKIDTSDSDLHEKLLHNLFFLTYELRAYDQSASYGQKYIEFIAGKYGRYSSKYQDVSEDLKNCSDAQASKNWFEQDDRIVPNNKKHSETRYTLEDGLNSCNKAQTALQNEDYESALTFAKQSAAIYKDHSFTNTVYYAHSLYIIGVAYKKIGDPLLSISYLEESKAICVKLEGKNSEDCFRCNQDLSSANVLLGNFQKALVFSEENLRIAKFVYGEESTEYAYSLFEMGRIKCEMLEYEGAYSFLSQASRLSEKVGESSIYLLAELCVGEIEMLLGNIDAAVNRFNNIRSNNPRDSEISALIPIIEAHQALSSYLSGRYGEAEKLVSNIRMDSLNNETRESAHINALLLHALGIYYIISQNYTKAIEVLLPSLSALEIAIGKDNDTFAGILRLIGVAYLYEGSHPIKSLEFLSAAAEVIRRNYGASFPSYQTYLYTYYFAKAKIGKSFSKQDVCQMYESAHHLYKNTIFQMTRDERLANISHQSNLKPLIAKGCISLRDYETLYNYSLLYKGALLDANTRIERYVKQNTSDELKDKLKQLKALRQATANTSLQRKRNDVNGCLSSIASRLGSTEAIINANTEMQILEREILSSINEQSKDSDIEYSYQTIRNNLKQEDICVEFIEVEDVNGKESLSPVSEYYALLCRKDWNSPKCIYLMSKSELEGFVQSGMDLYTFGTKAAEDAYSKIWSQILSYVQSSSSVYFSPDGLLYKVPIENIPAPDGEPVCFSYQTHRVSSTRNICTNEVECTISTSALYGGILYDVDSSKMKEMSNRYNEGINSSTSRGTLFRSGGRIQWNYLPNTKDEIDHIAKLMNSFGTCDIYSGVEGNEESFKALPQKGRNIIHIASHSFYVENNNNVLPTSIQRLIPQDDLQTLQSDAMYRSGLVLAGANHVWLGQYDIDDIEDGILTSAEISDLDLSKTQLVVLSSCDSGLGDVTTEGTFGLQRAFKNAGVKTIIMTMWNVDDVATQYMMTQFYKHLSAGVNKKSAFTSAKAETKAKYKDPYYWAPFVMLD